jgi:Methyltransferase domain
MSISNILAQKIANYDSSNSMGYQFRAKRIKTLIEMMSKIYESSGKIRIIDIGGRKNYWQIIPQELFSKYNINITIVNLPGEILASSEEHYQFIHGNACNLNFIDNQSFDIVHSNSVIEHVGSWENMLNFAKEVKRLASAYYIQTPYFWFPIEPHFMCPFFHWLPQPVRINLIMNFDLGNHTRSQNISEATAKLENYRLLDKKTLQVLFPDSKIIHERFFGLTKSLTAVHCQN